MTEDLTIDEQALYARKPERDSALVHHSDRGSQYVSIRYTERLAQAGIEPSVGSRGDSYDTALAETINGLYKAELIHRRAPWRTREAVELAMIDYMERAHAEDGVNWYSIASHMLGLRHGLHGARKWRQVWSDHRLKPLPPREVWAMAQAHVGAYRDEPALESSVSTH